VLGNTGLGRRAIPTKRTRSGAISHCSPSCMASRRLHALCNPFAQPCKLGKAFEGRFGACPCPCFRRTDAKMRPASAIEHFEVLGIEPDGDRAIGKMGGDGVAVANPGMGSEPLPANAARSFRRWGMVRSSTTPPFAP